MPHRKTQSESSTTSPLGAEMVQVLVGPQKRSFKIHKALLCSTSEYFRQSLEAIPVGLSSSCRDGRSQGQGRGRSASASSAAAPAALTHSVLWFADQSTQMFELFVLWLYRRRGFGSFVDQALSVAAEASQAGDMSAGRDLHWSLVRLHLFAAAVGLPALQDQAMDSLQDLYLRLDWEVSPRFVRLLYLESDPDAALRLRKWAVAMVAWTLSGRCEGGDAEFQALFEASSELLEDYKAHLDKMASSHADVSVKNPQLRIPTNSLRNDERHFGFRMCSFHSHRGTVGQGRCPHRKAAAPSPLPEAMAATTKSSSEPSSEPCSDPGPGTGRTTAAPADVTVSCRGRDAAVGRYDGPPSTSSSPTKPPSRTPSQRPHQSHVRSVSRTASLERSPILPGLDFF